jgi:hypothetical protein
MLDHLTPLTVPQRAAELHASVFASLVADALAMDQALARWLPETDWEARSEQQRRDWLALALILREAFQALVLARLLIRQEQTYKGATGSRTSTAPTATPRWGGGRRSRRGAAAAGLIRACRSSGAGGGCGRDAGSPA